MLNEVSKANLITDVKQTPLWEWCVIKCGSKNERAKTPIYM